MRRKDCEYLPTPVPRRSMIDGQRGRPVRRAPWRSTLTAVLLATSPSFGASIRLWTNAVVTGDSVRLDDVAELRGFEPEAAQRVGAMAIIEAPPPGGSRVIEMSLLRSTLTANGANLAAITLYGASRCELTKPAIPEENGTTSVDGFSAARVTRMDSTRAGERAENADADPSEGRTLRQAVITFFSEAVRRYQARAEVSFDGASEQILGLSEPTYSFRVRNSSRQLVGLVPVEVDVLSRDHIVQTTPLSVRLTVFRDTIVARRAINQDATIQASDVEVVPVSLTRFEDLPANDLDQVVGQRAKRFIAAGTIVDAGLLTAVPLVLRGQLVTLVSEVGGVRIVTAGKAGEDGRLGEVIKVRSTDRRQAEFDAVVIGPGQAQIAQEASASVGAPKRGGES